MDVQVLKQADFVLSQCGRPTPPQGLSVVPFYRGIPVQTILPVGSNQTVTKEVVGDTVFGLCAISSTMFTGQLLYIQIQLPNGRFLMNTLMDITQMAGYGSWRFSLSKELDCPPGTKFIVTFDDTIPNAIAVQPIVILFEGRDKYFLKGGSKCLGMFGNDSPRYFDHPNQNILAPCWASGIGPITPKGWTDEKFIYSQQAPTAILVTGTNFAATGSIQIDLDSDFECRRILFDLTNTQNATGTMLAKLRTSSGYALMDDYIDVTRYLGSSLFVHDWHIPAGDQVFMDCQLINPAGAGNVQLQFHLDGVKRRKA